MLVNISNDKPDFFSFHLQSKYFKDITSSALFLFPKKKQVILFIPKVKFDDIEIRKRVMIEFMEFLSLIYYLKDERYINIIPNENVYDSELHIMRKEFDKPSIDSKTQNIILNNIGDYINPKSAHLIRNSKEEVIYEGVDLQSSIFDQVVNNLMGLLFVSEELKEFVKNKYKSKDDIRYEQGQIATWIGIGLALAFGILGLFNPFDKSNNQFNYEKLAPLMKNSNKIHQDIHDIMENLKTKKDSIKK